MRIADSARQAHGDEDQIDASLQERLAAHSDKLTTADKRIWAELSRDPTLAVFQSTEAIATSADVNQATVVRFAQKLGYSGFVELREALRNRVRDTTSPVQRLRKLVDTAADEAGTLAELLAHQAEALAMAATTVSNQAFESAADRLAAARTIHVFASGHATTLAELALRRLSRIGCHVVDLRGAPRDIIERVAQLGSDDALLAFAFRTPPRHLGALLDIAAEREAAIVAVTDVLAPDMARPQAQILAASRGRSGDYQTLTVPLAVMEALAIAVAKRAPQRATDALDRIGAVAERFEPLSSSRPASGPLDKRRRRNRDR
ncbi:MurR/RpiR family transcriptional regulator [Bauldia sp.]|uniref:MurR/RpiR family transcriptional regulator n=1 Tax=Bauldia sp. TaxID=2575872 RepID=UPI003BACD5A4